jgi:hypothetical protein
LFRQSFDSFPKFFFNMSDYGRKKKITDKCIDKSKKFTDSLLWFECVPIFHVSETVTNIHANVI